MSPRFALASCWLFVLGGAGFTQEPAPTRAEVTTALQKATRYFAETIADQGGYARVSSVDGQFSEGEGTAGPNTIWVQPPGTPAVGMAFLDVFEATGDERNLRAAEAAARALVKGQLRSGGWYYRIEFDPKKRREFIYRDGPNGGKDQIPPTPAPGGWDIWKQRKFPGDMTLIDDDTTPAAIRFLMRVDQTLKFRDAPIHEAAEYALASTMNAQFPIGSWSHNYDHFPLTSPSEEHYPIKAASYPESWSRTWTKDFTGCHMLNDRISQNMIATMLLAHRIYGDAKYRASAERGGKFLRLAQMPDPQPAWAQEYNRHMQPVWDRKFEPPAITGLESQDVLETLLMLFRETGDPVHLEPIPKALAYLKSCVLSGGKIARFYELRTNKPLYFTKDYHITFDKDDVPTHYGFTFPSRLASIEAEYRRLKNLKPGESRTQPAETITPEMTATARKTLASQDARGAWIEPGIVRDTTGRKTTPTEGVVKSQTFLDNVKILTTYLRAGK